MVVMVIMVIMVIRVIMLIRVIRVTSVKFSIGILTHQGHISKVNANADSVSQSVILITSRASCDAKNMWDLPKLSHITNIQGWSKGVLSQNNITMILTNLL